MAPSGNLWVAGQQIWLGPAMTGRVIRIWADTQRIHVLAHGHRIKTLPSRLDGKDLARLAASGAVPAGPAQIPPPAGSVIEIERIVNASGNISVGNHVISAGSPLAGQRVTVRLDGPVGLANGTIACPVPPSARWQISACIRLRSVRHRAAGPGRPYRSTALMPRSMATQVMTLEWVKCCRPERTSQISSSGSAQWRSTCWTRICCSAHATGSGVIPAQRAWCRASITSPYTSSWT